MTDTRLDVADRKIAELSAELEDWREAARRAAEESCHGERHCTCVPLLRGTIAQQAAQIAALREALREVHARGHHADC